MHIAYFLEPSAAETLTLVFPFLTAVILNDLPDVMLLTETFATFLLAEETRSFLLLALLGVTFAVTDFALPFFARATDFVLSVTLLTGCLTVTLITLDVSPPSGVQVIFAVPGPTAVIFTYVPLPETFATFVLDYL